MATAYRTQPDVRDPVAAELCARIVEIEASLATLRIGELCRRVDAIRSTARSADLLAVADIAGNLSDALGRDGRAALIRPYLDALRQACGCARGDRNPVHALLASISVRFAD